MSEKKKELFLDGAAPLFANADKAYAAFLDGNCTQLPYAISVRTNDKKYMLMRVEHFTKVIEHFENHRCEVRNAARNA